MIGLGDKTIIVYIINFIQNIIEKNEKKSKFFNNVVPKKTTLHNLFVRKYSLQSMKFPINLPTKRDHV